MSQVDAHLTRLLAQTTSAYYRVCSVESYLSPDNFSRDERAKWEAYLAEQRPLARKEMREQARHATETLMYDRARLPGLRDAALTAMHSHIEKLRDSRRSDLIEGAAERFEEEAEELYEVACDAVDALRECERSIKIDEEFLRDYEAGTFDIPDPVDSNLVDASSVASGPAIDANTAEPAPVASTPVAPRWRSKRQRAHDEKVAVESQGSTATFLDIRLQHEMDLWNLRANERHEIAAIVRSAINHTDCKVRINKCRLTDFLGKCGGKRVWRYLHWSEFFRVSRKHEANIRSTEFELVLFPGFSIEEQFNPDGSSKPYRILKSDNKALIKRVTIPGKFNIARSKAWGELARRKGAEGLDWTLSHDSVGLDETATVLIDNLKHIEIPDVSDEKLLEDAEGDSAKALIYRRQLDYARHQISTMPTVTKKSGRYYHALTSLKKTNRARCKIEGEFLGDVDAHAMFFSAVAALMPECEDKHRLIAGVQTGRFHALLNEESEAPYASLKEAKKQLNRQCLYWKKRDSDHGTISEDGEINDPQWRALMRKYPTAANFINNERNRLGSTLSVGGMKRWATLLQSIESEIFVKGAMIACRDEGIITIPIHDSLLCKESDIPRVKEIVLQYAEAVLGFKPFVNSKSLAPPLVAA